MAQTSLVVEPVNFLPCKIGTAHQVLDNLYASGYPSIPGKSAADCAFIYQIWKTIGIVHVVNLTQLNEKLGKLSKYQQMWKSIDSNAQFHQFEIRDRDTVDDEQLLQWIKQIHEWLQNKEKVLIHCRMGRGRTGTLCALLIHKSFPQWTFEQIMNHTNQCIQKRTYQKSTYHKINPLNQKQLDQVRRLVEKKTDQVLGKRKATTIINEQKEETTNIKKSKSTVYDYF